MLTWYKNVSCRSLYSNYARWYSKLTNSKKRNYFTWNLTKLFPPNNFQNTFLFYAFTLTNQFKLHDCTLVYVHCNFSVHFFPTVLLYLERCRTNRNFSLPALTCLTQVLVEKELTHLCMKWNPLIQRTAVWAITVILNNRASAKEMESVLMKFVFARQTMYGMVQNASAGQKVFYVFKFQIFFLHAV